MPIQEEITESASSDGCNGRDDDDPQEIQPPATRREHSAHREDGGAHKVEEIEDHTLFHNAELLNTPLGVLLCISPQALSERHYHRQDIRPSLVLEEKISLAAIPLFWRYIPPSARSISRYWNPFGLTDFILYYLLQPNYSLCCFESLVDFAWWPGRQKHPTAKRISSETGELQGA